MNLSREPKKLTKEQRKELDKFDERFGIKHFDKQGMPMKMADFVEKFEDWNYRVVENYFGPFCRVSTIWLGIDHGFGESDKPLIFESMVFILGREEDMDRYYTLSEAQEGHKRLVKKYFWRADLLVRNFILFTFGYLIPSIIKRMLGERDGDSDTTEPEDDGDTGIPV